MRDLPLIEDPFIGKVLRERFEVRTCIGKGGMGAIYRCFDREAQTEVAIKVLLADLTTDPEVIKRFELEIEATRAIRHPNVIKVLGSGRYEEDQLFLVMELLTGESAADYIDDHAPLPTEQVANIGAAVARGLGACHAAGIIHRDLKPENIVIIGDGESAKVFDFGLGLQRKHHEAGSERLTAMDIRIGTPMYMAPEYIAGGEAMASCDLYALGVLLYEAATGYTPFKGPAYEVLHHHVHTRPKPIDERVPGMHPQWLRSVIESLLEKDPAARPQSGDEIADLLQPAAAAQVKPAMQVTSASNTGGIPRSIVAVTVAFALVWHLLFLAANIGDTNALLGGDLITPHYAVQVAQSGADPYDRSELQAAAAADGVRRQVPGLYQPPSHLIWMAWTAMADLKVAHTASISLNEWALAAVAILLALWWRPLGSGVPVVLAATVAALTAIPIHHQAGQHQLLLMALVLGAVWADQTDRGWLAGVALGLALTLSLRPALFLVLFIAQRRYRVLLGSLAVFMLLQLFATAVVGIGPTVTFWGSVFPGMLMGDFTDATVNVDLPTNHAIASLTPGIAGAWIIGIPLVLGTGYSARTWTDDPFTGGARAASLCLLTILLPAFGREIHLVWAIPAIALCALAVLKGRLSADWAPFVGLSAAFIAFPMQPVVSLYNAVLRPDLPWIAPAALQIKLLAMLVLLAASIIAARSVSEADSLRG